MSVPVDGAEERLLRAAEFVSSFHQSRWPAEPGQHTLKTKSAMTCKINRVVSDECVVVLFISGGITGEHVDILRRALEQDADAVVVDLGNVTLVDREAVKLLAQSEVNGRELRNCPRYVREWVTRERNG